MIRRPAEADFFLIRQADVAGIAAELFANFNSDFLGNVHPDLPLAIAKHQSGWAAVDDDPPLDTDGIPTDFFELSVADLLPAFSASVDALLIDHPYAALLVSLHVLGHSATLTPTDSAGTFALNKFQHRQIELQESLRVRLELRTDIPLKLGLAAAGIDPDEDFLRHNFQVLQTAHQLATAICCPARNIKPVSLNLTPKSETEFQLEPWPFTPPVLQLRIPVHRFNNTARLEYLAMTIAL